MNVTISLSKDNRKIIKVTKDNKSVYLSSSYFPISEAEKVAKNMKFDKETILIIGLGNPYLIREIGLNNPNKNIIAIEPLENIYSCILEDKDLNKLLLLPNIRIEKLSSFELVKYFIADLGDFDYYIHPSYKFLVPFVSDIEIAIKHHLQNMLINKNTLKKFGGIWAKNFILSLKHISKVKGVFNLFGKFNGFNSIVVGAGPSLDYDIGIIKKLHNNSVIISSDTSFLPLLKRGIKPDIVVTVDPQSKNFLYLIYEKDYENVIFVCDTLYLPLIYEFIPNDNIFLFDSPFKLWSDAKGIVGEKGELLVGGSVVCTAIDLAYRIGSKNILLFGNDLSFTNHRMYCKYNIFEISLILESNFTNPYDPWNFISKYPIIRTSNKVGEQVFTDPRMLTFKKWIENYISKTGTRVFNLTSKGLPLEGETTDNLESFLNDDTFSRNEIENLKRDAISISKRKSESYIEILLGIREGLEKLKREIHGTQDFSEINRILEENLITKHLIELAIQDTLLSKYSENDFINALKFSIDYLYKTLNKVIKSTKYK